ncbi:MAG: leucine-rich repeat domain-containing protein [Treponema sp.]|jgi:hypothetical protein|nr:leucine-rich repeat domain-containing protein [Treponema sp.]
MKIKCNCGKKIEIEKIKKNEPIKVVCSSCENEIVINDTKSLYKKYIALLAFDVFLMLSIIISVVLLLINLNFKFDLRFIIFIIGLMAALFSLWKDKKIALRIIGTIVTVSTVVLLIWNSILLSMPKYSNPKDFFILIDNRNEVTILSYRGIDEVISIPPKIKKMKVKAIGNNAFKGDAQFPALYQKVLKENKFSGGPMLTSGLYGMSVNNRIRTVVLPDTIESIGKEAFAFTTFLSDIKIPGTVKTIGDRAFQESGITFIEIPDSVIVIGHQAFCGSPDLQFLRSKFELEGTFIGNKLNKIKIGSNVKLNNSFENDFDDFYNLNGCKAGIYVYNNGEWNMEAKVPDNASGVRYFLVIEQ